ncbi:MAG: hypothetical protein HYV07_06395 [Deltaproteobacteria bacterium]|nr:hypothetical protein [Deltaproteobacteria bacterium]
MTLLEKPRLRWIVAVLGVSLDAASGLCWILDTESPAFWILHLAAYLVWWGAVRDIRSDVSRAKEANELLCVGYLAMMRSEPKYLVLTIAIELVRRYASVKLMWLWLNRAARSTAS